MLSKMLRAWGRKCLPGPKFIWFQGNPGAAFAAVQRLLLAGRDGLLAFRLANPGVLTHFDQLVFNAPCILRRMLIHRPREQENEVVERA